MRRHGNKTASPPAVVVVDVDDDLRLTSEKPDNGLGLPAGMAVIRRPISTQPRASLVLCLIACVCLIEVWFDAHEIAPQVDQIGTDYDFDYRKVQAKCVHFRAADTHTHTRARAPTHALTHALTHARARARAHPQARVHLVDLVNLGPRVVGSRANEVDAVRLITRALGGLKPVPGCKVCVCVRARACV